MATWTSQSSLNYNFFDYHVKNKNLLPLERGVPEAWVATGAHELEVIGELAEVEPDERLVHLHPQLLLLAAQENLVGQVEGRVDPT